MNVGRGIKVNILTDAWHPTKIICKIKNNTQKYDNETRIKQLFEFFHVAGKQVGVPHFQEDNE